ncbi:hypothetical protein SY88_14700 [Clostridiales bacterium PH28_bin88]|nr:hypothetical protein SY88_14700 [Clostridiales bacterium PH28_bin88]
MEKEIISIEGLALKIKTIIDNQDSVSHWNNIRKYLFKDPAMFFGVLDKRYLGKRRLQILRTAMAYESKGEAENSIEVLVFRHLSNALTRCFQVTI